MSFRNKKKLAFLRAQWGKEIERFRNIDLISIFNTIVHTGEKENMVDSRTWNDLNFDSIFAKMDRCTSYTGQQYLYHMLHRYERDENVLKRNYRLIESLRTDSKLRESIQLNILNLDNVNAYFIPHLLFEEDLPFTKFYPIFYLFSLFTLASAVMVAFNGAFLFIAVPLLINNLAINKIYAKKIYRYFSGFSSLNSLISSASALTKIKTGYQVAELETLRKKKSLLKKMRSKLGFLIIDKTAMNELLVVLIEYLNMFLLFDVIAYYRSVSTLLKHQKEISDIYESVGKLDALISVASYLEEIGAFCNPVFGEEKLIKFAGMYHPLIENAVSNSLSGLRNSALITGSNMSGKTTFIKTVGINFILAQTLYICLAENFSSPRLFVKSAIKRDEDLESGKSYFFAEVEELQEFVELSRSSEGYIFLIDEIFRGTNTVERLAASTSVLKYLDGENFVFVTTHDIELQYLLENNYRMFHFSDSVDNGEYIFDHKIHDGPCSSGNAIKLLEIKNYPRQITDEAFHISKKLLSSDALDEEKYRDAWRD